MKARETIRLPYLSHIVIDKRQVEFVCAENVGALTYIRGCGGVLLVDGECEVTVIKKGRTVWSGQ